jgi:hypothetical protein
MPQYICCTASWFRHDIIKAHSGELKWRQKRVMAQHLPFKFPPHKLIHQLFNSQIKVKTTTALSAWHRLLRRAESPPLQDSTEPAALASV